MSVERLSVSLDAELAASVRAAAAERNMSVSTWLAEAANAQVRQRRLREALDATASEEGTLGPAEVDELIAHARRGSTVVTRAAEGAA